MATKGQYMELQKQDIKTTNEEKSSENSSKSAQQENGKLEDDFDRDFWVEIAGSSISKDNEGKINMVRKKHVKKKDGKLTPWSKAVDEVRVARLINKWKDKESKPERDPLLVLIKEWPTSDKYRDKAELVEILINKFAEILLEDKDDMNKDNRYETYRDKGVKDKKTLLHYVAEQNFHHVARTLIKYCPGLLALKTEAVLLPEKKLGMLPVEIALKEEKDEVAAVMIRYMSHERIQSLFSWMPNEADLELSKRSLFSFQKILANPKMKKSSVATLDCMVNPHWPYLPERRGPGEYEFDEEKEGIEGAWSTVPDDPLDYHFFYHVLDGDNEGRPPKIKDASSGEYKMNKFFDFNRKSQSCLNVIAKSKNMDAIRHPAVRMLIRSKWKSYGHIILCVQAMLCVLFLTVLSYALIYGSTRENPLKYVGGADGLRGFCEVATLIMLIFYMSEEINQMSREQAAYFKDFYNIFDWLGILLVLLVVPFRVVNHDVQWILASLGYLFNCFRIFKFSCITRTTSLYTNTLARIIRRDISRFLIMFAIIFFSFCGALFLSLRASRSQPLLGGFGQVLLSGMRALTEQQPIAEDYSKYNLLSILLLLTYMGTVIVVLLNILIAQLSTTYTQARNNAKLQYDVDRMLLLTRMENYPVLNLRVRYYVDGVQISELSLIEELLEFSDERHSLETTERKLEMLRDLMRKIIKTMKPVGIVDK